MEVLTKAITQEKGFSDIIRAIETGRCPALLSGTGALPRAHTAAAIYAITGRPVIAVCADEAEANRFATDVAGFLEGDNQIDRLYAREFVFHNAEGVSRDGEQRRISVFSKLLRGTARFVTATPDGLMMRTMPPDVLKRLTITLKAGGTYDVQKLAASLVEAGYERTDMVEGTGQFSIRGGIFDVFTPTGGEPVRCEFFGDEIDSMGYFDVSSQRRTENTGEVVITPSREAEVCAADGGAAGLAARLDAYGKSLLKRRSVGQSILENIRDDLGRIKDGRSLPASDRYLDLLYEPATALDYIPRDAVVILCEPARLAERAKNYIWQLSEDLLGLKESGVLESDTSRLLEEWPDVIDRLRERDTVMLANFTASSYPMPPRTIGALTAKQLPSYGGSLETAASDIKHYMNTGYSVVVLVKDRSRGEVLKEYLAKQEIRSAYDMDLESLPDRGRCVIARGSLSAGLEYPDMKLAVITEGQIMQRIFRKSSRKKLPSKGQKLDSFTDLTPGNLVVHEQYGIGRFVGMVKRRVDGVERDYIKIAYAGTDTLYIPATQLDAVTKYIGAGDDTPVRLSKLGGTDWARAKVKAKAAVRELADGLIKLQAERRQAIGHAFSPDKPWQTEFEDGFEYQETDDQLRATKEIKADMESPVPMDRLLCGDVGYGKTEVALRAVMKCVLDGYQAAVLVPTTVLAQQHYQTIARRFSGFPFRVEILSRFCTPAEIRKTTQGLADGSVDIVVGTHKLLQKSVKFSKLGLLVVDEEQRFGVTHKERLKEMSKQVDVLTLSATPIPRTLNMALSGVRDMSTIEEPPSDRQPVQTYVMEHDWSVLTEAIRREVSRGGQVYYLYNRVETIDRKAIEIRGLLDGINVAVAHGRMEEDALNSVMESMQAGEIQVLVCTTIIETGIDIPNVNTLIIEDADRMGLAQLHQIRGRVGRSSRRAFAYFTFRRDKVLSEVADKRLSAIREFAQFNSGFKIAMRDLEIRGAGNILGAEQSGHMMSVGYDMYLKLLDEAVHEGKGEKAPEKTDCSADLAVSANIPDRYVSSGEQRMDLYRRIAHIRTKEDADDMTDELIDRYGDPPQEVQSLISIALLRGEASEAGISEISQKTGKLVFGIADFEMDRISRMYATKKYKGRVLIEAGASPTISLKLRPGDDALETASEFVRDYLAS